MLQSDSPCLWRFIPFSKAGLKPTNLRSHALSRPVCSLDTMLPPAIRNERAANPWIISNMVTKAFLIASSVIGPRIRPLTRLLRSSGLSATGTYKRIKDPASNSLLTSQPFPSHRAQSPRRQLARCPYRRHSVYPYRLQSKATLLVVFNNPLNVGTLSPYLAAF